MVIGISVGAAHVHAVLWWRDAIHWAGAAPYDDYASLGEVIARLASEAGAPVRRARVVLERDVVQLRSIVPAPPLKPAAMRRYVALEAPRLFRQNGAPLVTDGVRVAVTKDSAALWAGAAPEPLVRAVLAGCAQAGLALEGLGSAAEVLPRATSCAQSPIVFANGGTSEVLDVGQGGTWQSRLTRGTEHGEAPPLVAPLAALGAEAHHFAAAFGAAIALPRLTLLPVEARTAQERRGRRRMMRLFGIGAALWLAAASILVGRLAWIRQTATRSLGAAAPAVDSALVARRDLDLARATLGNVARAEEHRSRHLALLAAITQSLGDSTYLAAFQVTPDGVVRLSGYAPAAARVVAQLERLAMLRDVKMEGPVTREHVAGSTALKDMERDRFAIVARIEVQP
ncbi:MAG TPA: hypothetical protein VK467_05085 [Gemmatimonadales bacterium]|nr:hypothetical protein [Gemmatimonadales bacterium]